MVLKILPMREYDVKPGDYVSLPRADYFCYTNVVRESVPRLYFRVVKVYDNFFDAEEPHGRIRGITKNEWICGLCRREDGTEFKKERARKVQVGDLI